MFENNLWCKIVFIDLIRCEDIPVTGTLQQLGVASKGG